ncbi:MAG: transglutaminase-like domain-containing protein [Planctomycetes bacterium]|nr:transglutaminase-like domain-containing protein [Planctomycetota bacterium]
MRHGLVYCILLLVLAGGGKSAAGDHPWNDKRIYYVMEYRGELREKGYFTRRAGSYRKAPCVVVEEEKFVYAPGDGVTPLRILRLRTLSTPDGTAIQRSEEVVAGDSGREVITVENGEAVIEASGMFGTSGRIPVPPGAVFELSGEWFSRRPPRAGTVAEVDVLDRRNRTVATETVEIVESIGTGAATVWRAVCTSPGRPPLEARFTADGRLLRLESAGLVYQVVERDDYEAGRIPRTGTRGHEPARAAIPIGPRPLSALNDGDYFIEFPEEEMPPAQTAPAPEQRPPGGPAVIAIAESIPAWDNFAWLQLQAWPSYEWAGVIHNSEYARIDYVGDGTGITAVRNAPRVDSRAVLPMAVPPDIQPYLTHSPTIPSNHPAIIDAAYQAVADTDTRREETNVLRAVSYLAGWVNQTIDLEETPRRRRDPVDALTDLSGDATAHARIFAAMARSLGIPTRLCQGFLAQTGRAVFHCWAEAWINGSWIPVDTTVSRVGLPAGYVLVERSGGDGALLFDFVGFLRNPALTLSLTSAGRETPRGNLAELVVGDRRTYARVEEDWMANLFWGFALRLPPDWRGSARLNSVEMTSPDGSASVKCEALPGSYSAGKAELDSNVASLRANLSRFRLVDSRVVSFDPDGATPALFMDFTCTQDGLNLRCRQYVVPRRHRAFRISFWAAADRFSRYTAAFDNILATFEF